MNGTIHAALSTALGAGLLTFGVATRAYADEGYLPPNSTACTDQVRSDRGAFIYGRFMSDDPPTRRVFYSETPDGEAVEPAPGDAGGGGRRARSGRPPARGCFLLSGLRDEYRFGTGRIYLFCFAKCWGH